MTKPDRIPCVVPFCRRTAKRLPDDGPDAEIICGKHYRLADQRLRKAASLARRRGKRFYEKYKAAHETGQIEVADELYLQCERHYRIHNRLWRRIKSQAIEAAAGIRA